VGERARVRGRVNCGESYFTAATMHEIERVKARLKSLGMSRPVPVAHFAQPG
jgi:hypothetical protein